MSSALLLLLLIGEPAAEAEASAGEPEVVTEGAPAPDEPSALPEPPTLPEPPPGGEPVVGPPPEFLLWRAPVGCPNTADLRRGIERRLGRALSPTEVQVQAQVVDHEGGYRLTLQTRAGDVVDDRTLDADDCGALADATALIVALAVDPVAVAGAMELWGAAESEVGVAPIEPLPQTVQSARPPPRRRSPEGPPRLAERERGLAGGIMRLAGGVGLGAVPGATGTFSLAGGLRWPRARLEVEGAYWIPRRSEPVDGARVRVQLGTVGVRGCGVLTRDRLSAPLCGGVQVGGMRGAGEDTPGAQIAQGLWFGLEAGVGLSWWFAERWALAGGFSAAVPLVQPGFELAQDPPVRLFEPSAVAGRLWLGIELRLNSP